MVILTSILSSPGSANSLIQVTVPICAMKGGEDLQKYIDLLIPGNAKMKLIHGEGPINLVGSHCVDFFGFKDEEEEESDEEDEGDTENEMETEETSTEEKTKKASPAKDLSASKKASPAKDSSTTKKATPEKGDYEKKVTPSKDDSKKRKASSETKSAEKKAKN